MLDAIKIIIFSSLGAFAADSLLLKRHSIEKTFWYSVLTSSLFHSMSGKNVERQKFNHPRVKPNSISAQIVWALASTIQYQTASS